MVAHTSSEKPAAITIMAAILSFLKISGETIFKLQPGANLFCLNLAESTIYFILLYTPVRVINVKAWWPAPHTATFWEGYLCINFVIFIVENE